MLVILGLALLFFIAKSYNDRDRKAREYEANYKHPRQMEEFLSIWLTFFIYACLEPELHEDPWADTKRDIYPLIDAGKYNVSDIFAGIAKVDPVNKTWNPPNLKMFQSLAKFDHDEDFHIDHSKPEETKGYYAYMWGMAKRYDELIDLYSAWFDDGLVEKYPCPYISDRHYRFENEHSPYRTDPRGYCVGVHAMDYGVDGWTTYHRGYNGYEKADLDKAVVFNRVLVDVSLLDIKDWVPDQAKRHYGEIQWLLEDYWKRHNINPTSYIKEVELYFKESTPPPMPTSRIQPEPLRCVLLPPKPVPQPKLEAPVEEQKEEEKPEMDEFTKALYDMFKL